MLAWLYDHLRLLPDLPSQLHPCHVVMVSEKAEYNVSVGLPYRLLSHEHFMNKTGGEVSGKMHPAPNKKWGMVGQ